MFVDCMKPSKFIRNKKGTNYNGSILLHTYAANKSWDIRPLYTGLETCEMERYCLQRALENL